MNKFKYGLDVIMEVMFLTSIVITTAMLVLFSLSCVGWLGLTAWRYLFNVG